jgi:hypothetical protein
MKKSLLTLLIIGCALSVMAQSPSEKKDPYVRYVGKFEGEGNVIQFALKDGDLVLIAPGAPVQKLKFLGENKFQSRVFTDQHFAFSESHGVITEVITGEKPVAYRGKKIDSDGTILSDVMDSLFTHHTSTEHFLLRYSAVDSNVVDSIANDFETNYKKVLHDFRIDNIPRVTVRIYPDLKSFHNGINLPGGADHVLATAFGTDDIRMVSPNNAGPERWMLPYAAPHEFTHCVQLIIDYSPNNPRWLWEGVAQYEAAWFFNPAELDFIKKKEFPHLTDLNNGMEYMLGFAIIEAIKDLWGFNTVIELIQNRGDVKKVLKIDTKEFEEKIFKRIYAKYVGG